MSLNQINDQNASMGLLDGIQLDPRKLSQLGEKDLYLLLTTESWKKLNAASRLALLQEMENRQAKLDGRPPVHVISRKLDKRFLGFHGVDETGREVIALNEKYFKQSKLFGGQDESVFNVAKAINTLTHEGRHAFQYHATKERRVGLSREQILEWAATMPELGGVYIDGGRDFVGFLLYSFQGIEEDARRFARRRVARMQEFFQANGIQDPNFSNAVNSDRNYELGLIQAARANLTLPLLDKLEKSIVDYFSKLHPEIDTSKLTLFDNARLILQHPEITDLNELLDLMDRSADQKLGLREGKYMNLQEKIEHGAALGGIAASRRFP